MASIRRGYSDDFTLKNNSVGIGTSTGQEALDVIDGAVKGQDLKVTGVSSFTAYEGFLRADHQITENTTLSFDQGPVSSLSGEIIVGTGQTVTVNEIVKDTAGVGNGTSQWNDLNGNVTFSLEGNTKWNGSSFFDLDGTGDFLYQRGGGTDGFTFGTGDFAIEQWVYISTTGQQHFYEGRGSTSTNTILIYVDSSTILKTYLNGSNAIADSGALTQNAWHHIVLTRSGSTTTLYKNGTSVGTYSDSLNYVASPQGIIYFGSNGGSDGLGSGRGSYVTGRIGITRTYKGRALTLAEVTLNYNSGYTATTSAVAATVDLNPNVPASYPGTVRDVDTTDFTRAGGSEIECLKVFNSFTPPSGGTNERPYAPKPGELYYNYDLKTIEFFDGFGWRQVDNTTRSGRGVFGGGQSPTFVSLIDYVNVNTLGNAVSFGDMVASSGNNVRSGCAPVSSSTRGIFLGGGSPTRRSDCDYITIASEGNGIDFGNLTETAGFGPGASSSTRGLRFGGATPTVVSTIDYVQIPTTGDAIDFGELTQTVSVSGAASSPTRAVRAGGSSTTPTSKIDTVTIASTGNATDFGELSQARQGALGNVNSSTRGIFGGGRYSNPANHGTNTIDYITLSSIGNAIDFGDLTTERQGVGGACTQIRGVFAGGADYTPSASEENVIDFIMIASTGNGQDFGDLTVARQFLAGISDSHGGLGGF